MTMAATLSKQLETKPRSRWIMASYGMGGFYLQILTGVFGMYVFFYYETVIGLDSWLCALGLVIYSIWNAINDPLMGFLLQKIKPPFADKLGRRFPWILIGAIPWGFVYLLIFIPPDWDPVNQRWLLFLWLVLSTCLFDTVFTMWDVNYQALYPDKFRGIEERRTTSGIVAIIGIIGIAIAAVIPPMFVEEGDKGSYLTQAWVCIGIGLVALFLMIPGVREDKIMVERYAKTLEQQKTWDPFFKILLSVFKNRNFMGFIILYWLHQSSLSLLSGSVNYITTFVLGTGSEDVTPIMASMLVGGVLTIPFWTFLSHKLNNNKRLALIAAAMLAIGAFPMIFTTTLLGYIISTFTFGMGFGGMWFIVYPIYADIIDEIVVNTGKRQDGVYMGIRALFARLSVVVQALTFAVIHKLTGFVEGVSSLEDLIAQSPTPELAVLGIHLHSGAMAVILMLIGIVVFWRSYSITPSKREEIKIKLAELGI